MTAIEIAPGVRFWREYFSRAQQHSLIEDIFSRAKTAPFYKAKMPKSDKPFSVEETNFGTLGWFSDRAGYRYIAHHPQTGHAWPPLPDALLTLWKIVAPEAALPECCLVNLYRDGAKMGLHQDRDEEALDAPVVSVSLGDDALFRIGAESRKGPTRSVKLSSGDVITFGGPARLAFHGVDRVIAGTSTLVPGGGRINLTLRRVKRIRPS
jgi:alkylated DNA repair protein (DNA oxidative demethylase)